MKKLVMFGGPRAALLPDSGHPRADRTIAYRAVPWAAWHLLRWTDTVICDGGFGHDEDRNACRRLADEYGAAFYVVEFTAPLATLPQRNRERGGRHPGLGWTRAGLVVDCSRPLAECIDGVRAYLETEGM